MKFLVCSKKIVLSILQESPGINTCSQQINVDTSLFSYGYGCLVFLSLFSGTSVLSYAIAFMFPSHELAAIKFR